MPQAIDSLTQMLEEITREKRAAPAGVGKTTHPVMDSPDGTQAPAEGERSRENERQVSEEVPGENVEKAPEAPQTPPDAADAQNQMGTRKSETGGDPAVEDDYRSSQPDPGTNHPAKSDFGRKYGQYSFAQLRQMATKQAHAVLADVIVRGADPQEPAPAVDGAAKAARAGYAAAALAGAGDPKLAAIAVIEGTMKEAIDAGIATDHYLRKAADALAGGVPEEGVVPPGAGEPPGAGKLDLGAMLAGGGGGGAAPPAGPPPGAGGGMAPGAGGGMAPGAEGGMPGDASHEEILHELVAAMMEMGISPEELMAEMQAAGGAGGGPEATGGGEPEVGIPEGAEPPAKAAAARVVAEVRQYRRSGKFAFAGPASKRADGIRRHMRSCLAELVTK